MPTLLVGTIYILWLLSALVEYADYCSLWQLKEYRRDRFRDFMSTEQGKRYFIRFSFVYRFLALFAAVFWPINDTENIQLLFLGVLACDFFYFIFRFFRYGLKRPKLTVKALLIILTSMAVGGSIFFFSQDWVLPFFLLVSRFFILTAVVALWELPTRISKKYLIASATKKMKNYPKLTVIGITGSYGKSSVKEFTSHLLSQKYNIIKTPKNTNSEIGIAKFILQTNFSEADFFVVEMGAYTMGEIKLICDMVQPTIGVLTAVAEQHLSLFGSMKNIQTAKYELLRSLPPTGLVITNADNHYCTELLSELQCKNVITFGTDEEKHPNCLTTDIRATTRGTEFEGTFDGHTGRVSTPVIGAHHAYNIAPAAIIALRFGLTREQIEHGCATLPTDIHGSLQIYHYGAAIIVDDSYNSNPQGFKSALDVLASYSSERERIVITRGMLELGEKSFEMHERIGEEIAFAADQLVVITPDFLEPLQRGVGQKYRTKVLFIDEPEKLLQYLQTLKEKKCVVLLENRLPANIVSELSTYHS